MCRKFDEQALEIVRFHLLGCQANSERDVDEELRDIAMSSMIRNQFGINSGSIRGRFGIDSGSIRDQFGFDSGSIRADSGSNGQTAVRLDGQMAERPYGHMAERPNVAAGKKTAVAMICPWGFRTTKRTQLNENIKEVIFLIL